MDCLEHPAAHVTGHGSADGRNTSIATKKEDMSKRLPVRALPAIRDRRPAQALDAALDAIAARYGPRTRDVVAVQPESATGSIAVRRPQPPEATTRRVPAAASAATMSAGGIRSVKSSPNPAKPQT